MTSREERYNRLIARLKTSEPTLSDSSVLLADILASAEASAVQKQSDKSVKLLMWVTSVAAIWLMGLFLFQQITPVDTPEKSVPYPVTIRLPDFTSGSESGSLSSELHSLILSKRKRQKERDATYLRLLNQYTNIKKDEQ